MKDDMHVCHLFVVYPLGGPECCVHRKVTLPFAPYYGLRIQAEGWSFTFPDSSVGRIHYDIDRKEFIVERRDSILKSSYTSFRDEMKRMLESGWKLWRAYELKAVLRRMEAQEVER